MDSLLQKEIFKIVTNGAFGKNVSFVSFEQDQNCTVSDQYASIAVFGDVITSDSKFPIMIKLKPKSEKFREIMNIDEQFQNEITMYDKIIPFLINCCNLTSTSDALPSFPRFFYGQNRCGEFVERDIIILENVSPLGFRMSDERLFLDYDHLVNAIQALAKFHAMTYVAKHKDPQGFHRVIAEILNKWRTTAKPWLTQGNALWKFGKRGVDGLLARSGHLYRDNDHLNRFIKLIAETDGGSLRRAVVPREPFSVVCHGDFNRNNVMFRYDGDARPADTMLFDFGTPQYGSPALDLSFFLYMNTTQRTRRDRWDDLLDAYCATLAGAVPRGVRVPDRADIDAEMAASAVFGFAHAAFFLPVQIDDHRHANRGETTNDDNIVEILLLMGGDAGTGYVADMVQHIVDMGYTNV